MIKPSRSKVFDPIFIHSKKSKKENCQNVSVNSVEYPCFLHSLWVGLICLGMGCSCKSVRRSNLTIETIGW